MEKHFVTFLSPGSFTAESTSIEIEKWNVDEAVAMSAKISERYAAKPYGFYFTTRGRGPDDFDSKETAHSPMYYLGGEIRTVEDVRRDALPDEKILLSNMKCNHWDRIVTNRNSYRFTQPLNESDVVLDVRLPWIHPCADKRCPQFPVNGKCDMDGCKVLQAWKASIVVDGGAK